MCPVSKAEEQDKARDSIRQSRSGRGWSIYAHLTFTSSLIGRLLQKTHLPIHAGISLHRGPARLFTAHGFRLDIARRLFPLSLNAKPELCPSSSTSFKTPPSTTPPSATGNPPLFHDIPHYEITIPQSPSVFSGSSAISQTFLRRHTAPPRLRACSSIAHLRPNVAPSRLLPLKVAPAWLHLQSGSAVTATAMGKTRMTPRTGRHLIAPRICL